MISNVLSIPESVNMIGEDNTKKVLSTYSCVLNGIQLNEEVKQFVRNNAVDFYKRKTV